MAKGTEKNFGHKINPGQLAEGADIPFDAGVFTNPRDAGEVTRKGSKNQGSGISDNTREQNQPGWSHLP